MNIHDLWQLQNSTKMFVNKLHAGYHPIAYSCLEEQIFRHVQGDIAGESRLNISVYENSNFVKHRLKG